MTSKFSKDRAGFLRTKTGSVSSHFRDLYLASHTFPQILSKLLEHYPQFPMYSLLNKEGEVVPSHTRTVAELAHQAISVLELMKKENKIERGDSVVLIFFPSVEFLVALWACFLGGVKAIPLPPPIHLSTDLENFNSIVSQVGAKVCLSHKAYHKFSVVQTIAETVSKEVRRAGGLSNEKKSQPTNWPEKISWVYVDETWKSAARSLPPHQDLLKKVREYSSKIQREEVAFLQLTESSKLIKWTHRAANYNPLALCGHTLGMHKRLTEPNYQKGECPWSATGLGKKNVVSVVPEYHRSTVICTPHYHLSFFTHIMTSLLFCSTLCIMSPTDFLIHPLGWIKASIRLNAVLTSATNLALEYVVLKSKESDRLAFLKKSPVWRTNLLVHGGERMLPTDTFLKAFPFIEPDYLYLIFEPVGGITGVEYGNRKEISTPVRMGNKVELMDCDEKDCEEQTGGNVCSIAGPSVVAVKRGVESTRIIVANPETFEELPEHHIGEVWVSSPCVGQGYFGWSDFENEKIFSNLPEVCLTTEEHRVFMKTGVQGFLENGTVFVQEKQKAIVDYFQFGDSSIETIEMDALPEGAEDIVLKIRNDLKRIRCEEEGGKKRQVAVGLNILEGDLEDFSVFSLELEKLQFLVKDEFDISLPPSCFLPQIDQTCYYSVDASPSLVSSSGFRCSRKVFSKKKTPPPKNAVASFFRLRNDSCSTPPQPPPSSSSPATKPAPFSSIQWKGVVCSARSLLSSSFYSRSHDHSREELAGSFSLSPVLSVSPTPLSTPPPLTLSPRTISPTLPSPPSSSPPSFSFTSSRNRSKSFEKILDSKSDF